jgi:hypothetical protein
MKESWCQRLQLHYCRQLLERGGENDPIYSDFFLNNTLFFINSRNNIRFLSFTGIIHRRVSGTRNGKIGVEEPDI